MSRRHSRGLVLDGLLLSAWLVMIGLVVLHERGQLWGRAGNLAASLIAPLEAKEQWFGLYFQGEKVGFAHTLLLPEEREGVPGVGVIDSGRLFFNLLGEPQQLQISARAFIDADWRLRFFAASVQSATSQLAWTGQRYGDDLVVSVTTPGSSFTKRVKDPTGNAFVNGLSSWAAFHRLQVGQSGKAWVFNPLALNPEVVFYNVRRREWLEGTWALVVESDIGGMMTTSWVTPEGDVLKEVSPLGWELRREDRQEALRRPTGTAPALDLLSAASVSLDRPLEHPTAISRMTLLVRGVSCETIEVQRPWQRPLPESELPESRRAALEEPWCLLELRQPVLGALQPAAPESVHRYQQPSPFVQSDDPRVIATARTIVGTRTDPFGITTALSEWVHRTMKKRLTVGLPSALDILATPVGDCHEHTVLFTALARSVGLPTRMVAGLVYWERRLYYHAWPEVWLGEWLPTDPTLGQPIADATHLGFIEAENEHLISLAQFVGKVRVEVVDVR